MKHSKNGRGKRRNSRRKRTAQDRTPTFTEDDIVSKADLEAGNNLMSLPELRNKSISELQASAEAMNIENLARARRQDITFAMLKAHAADNHPILSLIHI